MTRCETLIIGGGVVGASVAWHLASRGERGIVVVDGAAAPGEGSTGKATGGFRLQFATEGNVRLALLAREKLLRFRDETGGDAGYAPCGYLFISESERASAALDEALAVQRACGVAEARRVAPGDIYTINPAVVRRASIAGGSFCSADGFIRPLGILNGYLDAARRLGVAVSYGENVRSIGRRRGAITSVTTSRGEYAPHRVVNAAGAWAGAVARLAQVDLPVEPLCRQVAVVPGANGLPAEMPLTVFLSDGFHLRVRDGDTLLLKSNSAPFSFAASLDDAWLSDVERCARERVKPLATCRVDPTKSWAGLYEMSPDKHAIIGLAPGTENFYLANGSSGHGVMHAPAIGEVLAALILEGAFSRFDISSFSPSRFVEGKANPPTEFL